MARCQITNSARIHNLDLDGGIKEKIDMGKELKYFFPKKDFWHSISKQLRSTNLITTYKQ